MAWVNLGIAYDFLGMPDKSLEAHGMAIKARVANPATPDSIPDPTQSSPGFWALFALAGFGTVALFR
jgi:hypothetical protein